jgi:hypothetical protein
MNYQWGRIKLKENSLLCTSKHATTEKLEKVAVNGHKKALKV